MAFEAAGGRAGAGHDPAAAAAGAGGGGPLARAAAGSLALRVASLGLGFACQLLLTRLLRAHSFGLYVYALAWMKALSVPATLGLERLIVREVAAARARSDWGAWRGLIRWADRTVLLASGGIALTAVAASWVAAGGTEGLTAFWLAMALLPLVALTRVRQYVMQGMHRAVVGQLPEAIIHPLLLVALAAAHHALWGGLTAAGAMGLSVAAACAALACAARLSARALPAAVKESPPETRPGVWMRGALAMLLVSGVQSVSSQIPVLVVGYVLNPEAAGVLAVAKSLADLTIIPTLALSAVLTPAMASLWAERDTGGLQRTLVRCARWVALTSLPIALTFMLFGRPLLGVFGAPFEGGAAALAILCAGQIVNVMTGSNGLLLVMTGREREVAFISTACALLNLGLCALLAARAGMEGAAAGAAASQIVWNLWLAWRVWRRLGMRTTVFARAG